jgi:hypothetical protein
MPNVIHGLAVEHRGCFSRFSFSVFFSLSVHERKPGGCVGLMIYYFVYEDKTNVNNNKATLRSEIPLIFEAWFPLRITS